MSKTLYGITKNQEKIELSTNLEKIILVTDDNIELELDFNPHPNFKSDLTLIAPINKNEVGEEKQHHKDSGRLIAITPGASNVVHIQVKQHL